MRARWCWFVCRMKCLGCLVVSRDIERRGKGGREFEFGILEAW